MKYISLTDWICNNIVKWEIICGISDRKLTLEEVVKLLAELHELADEQRIQRNIYGGFEQILL
ncbi:MAG: hypothetical protein FWD71_11305 [Oscillospiraceae bacterium]|nr:hypothetical protein [Oscillospiraceae bacterium]